MASRNTGTAQEFVEQNEPSADLREIEINGCVMYCVDLPYGASTAMFSDEERAWEAAKRMVRDEMG